MKTLLRTILILTLIISLIISFYYGLRFFDQPITYEFKNRSFVVTLPNRFWFEMDTSVDKITSNNSLNEFVLPFEDTEPETNNVGLDIGLTYPIYSIESTEGGIKKEQSIQRNGNTLYLNQKIEIPSKHLSKYYQYESYLFLSQFVDYKEDDNGFFVGGCNVLFSSLNGNIFYSKEYSKLTIAYPIALEIEDQISIKVECN